MLTGTEILSYCETRLGRNLDSDLALMAINEAIAEIGDMGLLYDTVDVEVTDTDDVYNMPDDWTVINKVILHKDKEYLFQNYTFKAGQIRFFEEGNFTIIARKMPDDIEILSEPITAVHPLYHNAIKFYTLAWMKENDDFEDQTAHMLYEKFERGVSRAAKTLSRSKVPSKVRVIR